MELLHRLVNEHVTAISQRINRGDVIRSDTPFEWLIVPSTRNLKIKMNLVTELEAYDELPRCVFRVDYCPPKTPGYETTAEQLEELIYVARTFGRDTCIIKNTPKNDHFTFDCEYRTQTLDPIISGLFQVANHLDWNRHMKFPEGVSFAYLKK